VRLAGDLDVAALQEALGAVVARHEVLRTRLVAGPDGVPCQVIDPPGPFSLPVTDVSGEPDPESAARALVAADAAVPFDLAAGPLLRARLVRVGAGDHVLVLSAHHVVFDEWSEQILRHELSALYEAFLAGQPDPLPPLAVQYADYAVWQRDWLTGEVLDERLGFWRRQLAGVPALDLPTDRPRPPVRSSAGAVTEFTVPAPVVAGLQVLSREHGVTMFMTLLAAYAVLLGRYARQDDVVIGTPVAGRDRAEIEELIGFFVNTLVLRADLSGDPSFTTLLARVRQTALDAYAHQDLPFEQLVDTLAPDRDRSRTPLFQVFFDYAPGNPADPPALHGLRDAPIGDPAGQIALFDLTLSMADTGDGSMAARFEYPTDLFNQATAESMAENLLEFLKETALMPDRPLSQSASVPPAELRKLSEWNSGSVPPATTGSVHDLIVRHVQLHPDAIAVVSGETSLTFAELDLYADYLARQLTDLGVRSETVVALCLDRGPGIIIAMLAIWRAGGACLPLDPEYPPERLKYMLADSQAAVLIGRHGPAEALAEPVIQSGGATVWLDDFTAIGDPRPEPVLTPASDVPGRLASVIYTSGSTGWPKATLVTHESLLATYAAWASAHFPDGTSYRWLTLTSVSFDVFTGDVVRALGSGGTLVIGQVGLQLKPAAWADLITCANVSAFECAPRYIDGLVEHLSRTGARLEGLRLVIATTDLWRTAAAAQAQLILGSQTRLLTAYGVTEATIDSTYCELTDLPLEPDRPTPIGGSLPGTRCHVLDRHLNPVPVGANGELYIGGAGVTRGYHNQPAATAERFTADPFLPGLRLYRTGDLVRRRPDGQLDFLGRADYQIKLRGYRIEPGEIESRLQEHPQIAAAVVSAAGDGENRRLHAHLVPADDGRSLPSAGELHALLKKTLPDYMIPAAYIEISALPLTPNGQLDIAALPPPAGTRPDLTNPFVPARTPTEKILAGIWAEILGLDEVGANDNFFELGGHSLTATQVIARIRSSFDIDIPLSVLFDEPTMAEVAAAINGVTLTDDGDLNNYEEFEF
jgi:amino acid adenylation domain-containing protein